MNANQILYKDHQVLFMNGPNAHPKNPRWRMTTISKTIS